jgi:hypothetical protein
MPLFCRSYCSAVKMRGLARCRRPCAGDGAPPDALVQGAGDDAADGAPVVVAVAAQGGRQPAMRQGGGRECPNAAGPVPRRAC